MFDLIVIGGGPGGYTAALECVALGKKVLIAEKEEIGGVCLNRGCIPTKSLLNSSKIYKKSLHSSKFGVVNRSTEFDFSACMEWKNNSVTDIRTSLTSLIESKKIEIVKGEAKIISGTEVEIDGEVYKTDYIIIATGSRAALPPIPGIDSLNVVTSREVLKLKELPTSIIIIGGGVIGVEFASFFSSVGVKTTIIEMKKTLIPEMEERLGKALAKNLEAEIHLNSQVESINGDSVTFTQKGESLTARSDLILIATGRKPDVKQFEELGIVKNGVVATDDSLRTAIDSIYAVGDVTGKSFLAHGSERMATAAVKNIFEDGDTIDYSLIPGVVYCDPEVASVGVTQKYAKDNKIAVKKSVLYLNTNGRYRVEGGNENGLCLVLTHKETDKIVGVHLIGNGVSEIISIATMAITKGFTVKEFKEIVFPHPTLSEIIKDTII